MARLPKSRVDFWSTKLEGNRARDARNLQALGEMGWAALVVWECDLTDEKALMMKIRAFLG